MDVGGWLRNLGLGQYEALFRASEIDADILPELTDADLEKLGVPLGHRKRLLRAISGLAATEASPAPAAPTGARPQDAAERRQLTVMFCDLVGSTALSARLDPEDLRGIIGAYHRGVTEIVEGFGGFVARYMGDGVLVYFGYPRAHEDDAERATRCGLALVDWVPQLDQVEEFQARVGIATGLVVVGGEVVEHDVAGDTPNLAARLQALAEPGQIVLAGATRRLIGDLFTLRDLGRRIAKGFAEPVEAFAVEGVAAAESRFEAARRGLIDFVGRAAERALLRNRLREAWAGAGQIVLLSGEAGIGKSRLAVQLAAEVANEPHTRLRYQCSPYHRDSVLHPFVVQLTRAARLAAEDPPETQLNKLEAILAPARVAETAPLVASLLSISTGERYPPLALSAAQQRRLTLGALLDQFEALAREKPVLMLFEDVHWADATSLEVLDLTVERVRGLPVLVLITFRPEYEAPWTGLSHVTSIALDRLAPAEVETLAEHVAGRPLPPEVMAQIVAKTDGVPLFVEELTKTVLEGGLLVAGPQGWRLDRPLPPFAIPATLQDSLAARLDRLAPVKEIAQIGAAIGREFSYPVLRAVAGRDEPALRAALVQLEEAELLFRTGAPPNARYTFKHALVQDTAYETLLRSRRQILHRQITDALRDEFPAIAAGEPELVAHHMTQAGLDEPATVWWGKAGDQALHRSAFKEAAAHLGKAIELADKLAASAGPAPSAASARLRLQTSLGNALIWVRGFEAPETSAAFARARELASREEDASERFSAYYGLWVGHMNRCEPAPLREMAELFLREATARPHCPEAVVAHCISGSTCFHFGDFAAAHDHFQKTIELYDQTRHGDFANRFGNDPRAAAEAYDALALWGLERVDEARRLAERAITDAGSAAHAPTTAYALMFAALLGLVRCNPEAVATCSQALADIVSRYDLPAWWAGWVTFLQGWAKWSEGAGESRLAEMRRSLAIGRERGQVWLLPRFEAALAEAEAGAGEIDAGLKRLDDALAELERTEQRWYEAEMHRIRGEILLQRDPADTAPAEQSLQAAIAIAQSQKARSFELRAALSLAKLYRAANRDADAHTVLAPAVEGFPPTQQFPELTEAQTLLVALSESDAVKSAATLRQRRLQLQISLGNALIWAKGHQAPETSAAFERARELASREEDISERFSAYYGLWVGHFNRCEPAPAREMAELFLREATALPNCPEVLVAHRVSGVTCLYFGDYAAAHHHFQKTIELYDQARHADFANRFGTDPRASAEFWDALTLWVLGRVDEALRLADRALADSAAHAATMAQALTFAARLGLVRYNPEAVANYSQALADIVSRIDLPAHYVGVAVFFQGWAKSSDSAEGSSLAEMRRGIAIYREQGLVWFLPGLEAALAEAEASAGETDAGLRRLDDALSELKATEARWYEAEMHRIRAEILLQRDPADTTAAEQSLQAAIAIAQSQKARSFELRAALALARLYRATNRDLDAHAVLAPAVDGFPPTQQFPELTEAQTLLSALSESDAVKSAAALHQRRVHLQTSLGNALIWAKGYQTPETSAAFVRARELASWVEDASERFSACYGLWVGHLTRGEPAPMREMAELFLREATARPDCPEALVGHRISGTTYFYLGDFAGAHDHFQKTIELHDQARHADFANRFGVDPRAAAEVFDALALWMLGRVDAALPLADRALAESAAHAPTMGQALASAALLGLLRYNPEAVATCSQASADIVSRYDLPAHWPGFAAFFQGWTRWLRGEGEAGLAEMRRGIGIFREQGFVWLLPALEAALAEAEASAGETDSGLRRLDDALAEAERIEQRWYEAEMHRIRGEILLKRDPADTAAAEQSSQAAIAIARSQKARSFELRAALSLAKLYRAADRDVDAHAVLAPAVEGFPPTQQFPELTEAQALLSALSP